MISVKDQLGNTVKLESNPERIISIVPSQTELLFDLGLQDEVVGITKFCVHPDTWFKSKTRIGGTKKVNIEKVRSLEPDLIIANKEENTREDIESLRAIAPVWISNVVTYEDALEMILSIGRLTKRIEVSKKLVNEIEEAFIGLQSKIKTKDPRVLYCIWNDPLMAVGSETFIDAMLSKCGFTNVVSEARYPVVNIKTIDPEFVFLSSEPFHFSDLHLAEIEKQFENARVMRVDGEAFSWYGSKMLKSPGYFERLINEMV